MLTYVNTSLYMTESERSSVYLKCSFKVGILRTQFFHDDALVLLVMLLSQVPYKMNWNVCRWG